MSAFLSMTATFHIHGDRERVETVEFTGVSRDDLLAQWNGVLKYLKREDHTVSSVCSRIERMTL